MESWFSRFGGLVSVVLSVLVFAAVWSFGVAAEVPVGSLKGTAVMKPSGKALPNAEVIVYPDFETPEDTRGTWTTRTDENGSFTFKGLPAGIYNVNVYGKAFRSDERVVVLVREGQTETVNVTTTRPDPDLDLHANQRVFLPTEPIQISLSGYTDEDTAEFSVYSVPFESVFGKRSPENLVRTLTANQSDADPGKTAGLLLKTKEPRTLTRKDVEGHFVEQVTLAPQPEGLILVQARVGKQVKYAWISVSKIALVTKSNSGKVLAFVADLKTGKPVEGARLSTANGSVLEPKGVSGADGTLTFKATPSDDLMVVVADKGSSRAFTWFYSGQGSQGGTVLWAQTDRPVYRPGDTVHYKIVARDARETGYSLSSGKVLVEILDPDETVVKKESLALNGSGSAHGSFKTDPQALPQAYQIRMQHGESNDTHWVSIVSYRKPEFRVTVRPKSDQYVRGETARFEVKVESYTGEPAPGMRVEGWAYRREDWSFNPFDDEEYYDEYPESDYLGDFVQELSGRTDESGVCVLEVATNPKGQEGQELANAVFSLDVNVQDESGRTTSSRGSVKVVRGLFDLKLVSDRNIVDPGQPVTVRLDASWNEDGTPVPGQKVELEYGHERWSDNKSVFVREGRTTVTLGEDGTGTLSLSPTEKGEFKVRATATDTRSNTVAAECWVWVESGGSRYDGPVPDISLVLDKPEYMPQDEARILVRTSHPGGTALLTVEADEVLWSKTIDLDENSIVVPLQGLSGFAPNATVSVAYVKDKEFYSASRNLRVDLLEKRIEVNIQPDGTKFKPGETVTYRIKTTDAEGEPVSANLALGVVDESVYAISEDTNDPLKVFYPRRWSSVQTAYSFPTLYLDGEDKNPTAVRVRKNFQDTAYWNPDVNTDATGQTTVSVRLPDNLTEWRATATAFTSDTRIGKSRNSVVSKRDLMVRWSLPMFLVEGDEQRASVRVSNTTDRAMTTQLRVSAENATLAGGETVQTLTLKPGQTLEPTWTLGAGDLGSAKFKAVAVEQGGAANDGEEKSVPVQVRGRQQTTSFVGETTGTGSGVLTVDPSAVAATLTVQVSPTLLSSLVQALPSLVDYPYGCLEQTMSRFVPAVLVVKLMRETGFRDLETESKLPAIVRESLVRIKRMQSGSGGWGWWEYDSENEWMTAYALECLWRVQQAGVETSSVDVGRALDWAEKRLSESPLSPTGPGYDQSASDRVALAAAVVLHRPSKPALESLVRLGKSPKLSTFSLARIVATLKRTGLAPAELPALYKSLLSRAEVTRDTAHWPEAGWHEPTAAALEAVVVMEPESPLVPKVFRYLMSQRRGDFWTSTRDTARILFSTTTFLVKSRELMVDENLTIRLNGSVVAGRRFTREDLTAAPYKLTVPMTRLKRGANKVDVQVQGKGRAYYTAVLEQSVRMDTMAAVTGSPDVTFERAFFRSTPQRLEDGSLRLVPSRTPTTSARSGEVLRCRVTVRTKNPLSNIMALVPIPSNVRIIEDEEPLDGATWDWWWARSVYTDDKAVFFGDVSPDKPQVIEFAVRAEAPGKCVTLPATLFRMYQPDEKSSTASLLFEVKPR